MEQARLVYFFSFLTRPAIWSKDIFSTLSWVGLPCASNVTEYWREASLGSTLVGGTGAYFELLEEISGKSVDGLELVLGSGSTEL